MNKKLEALRRGLRSFIEDTSRELADLEGRADDAVADRPRVAPAAAHPTPPGGDPTPAATSPEATPEPPPEPSHPGPTPPPSVRSQIGSPTGAAARTAGAAPGEPAAVAAAPPAEAPRPPAAVPRPAEPPAEMISPPAERAAKSPRRPQAAARRRQRPPSGAKTGVNGVRAEQVQARKGVCFAYFLNHECWRVPEAYCNSALQVCITRECPVYHLHREALERRFARKFKHFW